MKNPPQEGQSIHINGAPAGRVVRVTDSAIGYLPTGSNRLSWISLQRLAEVAVEPLPQVAAAQPLGDEDADD